MSLQKGCEAPHEDGRGMAVVRDGSSLKNGMRIVIVTPTDSDRLGGYLTKSTFDLGQVM